MMPSATPNRVPAAAPSSASIVNLVSDDIGGRPRAWGGTPPATFDRPRCR